ncbi:ATP-grasp domain-containing protein [Streptomyces sp. NPDC057496]|uniref:ATP-grasp domain-containing protein n=1 Tax=Streptomyces sp. NPDC057496 TaxID=3346149 RepID=UPI0036CF0E91
MSTRSLLVIGGAGPSALSIDACRRALLQGRARGLRVTLTAVSAAAPEIRALEDAADELVETDLRDPGQRRAFLEGRNDDLVFGVRDAMQIAVAETAEALGAPGNPVAAVRRAVTKDLARACLREAGLAQPDVALCRGPADALAFLERTTGPWVVKPRNATGSLGVTRLTGTGGLAEALDRLPDPAEFLVETFVPGEEYSVEGVFLGGEPVVLACTAKRKLDGPGFVETGHTLPAALSAEDEERLTAEVGRALRALGLCSGVFHVEAWLDKGAVVVGETHTRVGGDWIHSMVEWSRPGTELFDLVYADMLGERPPALRPVRRGAAAVYLTPPPGQVRAVDGWREATSAPEVLHAELAVGAGGTVSACRSSGDRVGVIVAGTPSGTGEAESLARRLCASVVFTLRDGSRHDGLGRRLPPSDSSTSTDLESR